MDDQPTETVKAAQHICPVCGGVQPMRIAYGYPSGEMIEAYTRGEVVLGGCIVGRDSPTFRCRECGNRWGGPPSRIDGLAAFFPGGGR